MNRSLLPSSCFATLIGLAVGLVEANAAVVIFDNLAAATENEAITHSTILQAQNIAPLSQSHTLNSVTLLMREVVAGSVQVRLFSGDADVPITYVGSLVSPVSITATLDQNTFTTPGISLDAGVNYWVVLGGGTGTHHWGYTDAASSGSGEGFSKNWSTELSGGGWLIRAPGPYQMSALATVPEPKAVAMSSGLVLGAVAFVHRIRKQRHQGE